MKAADVEVGTELEDHEGSVVTVTVGEGMPVVHEVANWAAWPAAVQCMRFAFARLLSEHPGTWVVAESGWDTKRN